MTDMVFLQCDNGSKAVRVACPQCGRISFQILKNSYAGEPVALLASELTCPLCRSVYRTVSTAKSTEWNAAFERYNLNRNAYNSAVKDNYTRQEEQKKTSQQTKILSLNRWEDYFSLSTLKRGESYAQKGRVGDIVKSLESISAKVQGEDSYQVNITVNNQDIVSMGCTCPVGNAGDLCKHMAAVLFVAVDGMEKENSTLLSLERTSEMQNEKDEAKATYTSVGQPHLASMPKGSDSADTSLVNREIHSISSSVLTPPVNTAPLKPVAVYHFTWCI